jgi:hypothetical protein
MFHIVEELVCSCIRDADRGEEAFTLRHSAVGVALEKWGGRAEPRKLAMALGVRAAKASEHFWRCKEEREHADYWLGKDYCREMAEAHIHRIKKILSFANAASAQLAGSSATAV